MKKHETYKDSGIEWIGMIPEGWEVTKLGWAFPNMGSGTTPDSSNDLYYVENGYNWLQTGDLTDGAITATSKHLSQIAVDEKRMKFYPVGSIVIAMYGATIGKVGYLEIETSTNQACCVLPPQELINNKYMFYLIQSSKTSLISKSIGGGQPNISQSIIQEHRIPVPPLSEQQSIASYLDHKVGQIDTSISAINSQIDDLKSYRQSIISEAVTKGLNPNTPMKDSGIEWIGMIPEGWEVQRIKCFVEHITTPCEGEKKIGLENIESKTGRFIETTNEFNGNGIAFNVDDVIYGKLRPYLQKVWLAEFAGNAVGDFFVYRVKKDCIPAYLKYIFLSNPFTSLADGSTYGAKMPRVSSEFISNTKWGLPSIEEQRSIATYLDNKTSKIDSTIKSLEAQRDDLNALKQSIISEAVTGKIDVRDWKPTKA